MFDPSNAKRVRREDLRSRASVSTPSSPDPELTALFQARFKPAFDANLSGPAPSTMSTGLESPDDRGRDHQTPEVEEHEFRLFAARPSKPTAAATTAAATSTAGDPKFTPTAVPAKIRIASPPPASGEGRLVGPGRPDSYYFADAPDEARLVELQEAAMSGEDVRAWCKRSGLWAGCRVPWKVRVITQKGHMMEADGTVGGRTKRTRKGKKARIAVRNKMRAIQEKEEAKKRSAAEKEQHLVEKKKRLNREKKLKRREKERAKKAENPEKPAGGDLE